LVRDRGPDFTRSFDAVFQATGATILRTAVQAPRMNAICERQAGALRREVLEQTLILGPAHLRAVLTEYQEHYNTARPHQGIGQRIPDAEHNAPRVSAAGPEAWRIRRKPVLSGLINEYERAVHGNALWHYRSAAQRSYGVKLCHSNATRPARPPR
jgi:putative transposase